MFFYHWGEDDDDDDDDNSIRRGNIFNHWYYNVVSNKMIEFNTISITDMRDYTNRNYS